MVENLSGQPLGLGFSISNIDHVQSPFLNASFPKMSSISKTEQGHAHNSNQAGCAQAGHAQASHAQAGHAQAGHTQADQAQAQTSTLLPSFPSSISVKRKRPDESEPASQTQQKKIFNRCSFSGPRYGPEFVLKVT